MKEELEVYDLKGKLIGTQYRDKFYSEIKKEFASKGKISKKIKQVRILLANSQGRIYLQKRSKIKDENPGLYDKTIGGHVAKDDTYAMTVIRECAEELGFPAAVVSEAEFDKAVKVTDLTIIGLFKKVDYIENYKSVRVTKIGDKFIQPVMSEFYFGYYDGSIRFVDGESSGIEVYSLDELKKEIKKFPDRFTEDLKFIIGKYSGLIKKIK